jgi:hypothetical protein
MITRATPVSGEGRLWAASFLVSLLLNTLLFGTLAKVSSLDAARHAKTLAEARPVVEDRWVAAVIPDRSAASASLAVAPRPLEALRKPFARTSPEQESDRPAVALFKGERNTRATSDRAPDAGAPPMPSQKGVEDDRFLATTESHYRDGELAGGNEESPVEPAASKAASQPATAATEAKPVGETNDSPGKERATSPPPARERLAEGPNPVEVEVQTAKTKSEDSLKRTPSRQAVEETSVEQVSSQPKAASEPPPKPMTEPSQPAFSGSQKKTEIRGSISRHGESSFDVEDSPRGRYEAAINPVLKREWQRKCVKYADLITPGYLTVRFVVESSGKVRSVEFVDSVNCGDDQKAFTLDSIRGATFPAMPPELKKQRRGEPLEILFNFHF